VGLEYAAAECPVIHITTYVADAQQQYQLKPHYTNEQTQQTVMTNGLVCLPI